MCSLQEAGNHFVTSERPITLKIDNSFPVWKGIVFIVLCNYGADHVVICIFAWVWWNWISARTIKKYIFCSVHSQCTQFLFLCVWRLISLSLSEAHWSELRSAVHPFSEAHDRRVSLWRTRDSEHLDDCCDGTEISKTKEREKVVNNWSRLTVGWGGVGLFGNTQCFEKALICQWWRWKRGKREERLCSLIT